MEVEGIDFAWTKPTAAEAKALGAHWAAGYYSTDATKNLTHALVSSYLAAGLAIVGVWETTTGRARQGYQAGIDDAGLADGERSSVGLPSDAVVYLAVDEDTDWASVAPYFNGASQVLGQARVGVYGGFRVIEGAAAAGYRYLWQTVAWSAGRWSSHATIRQEGGTVFGGNADIDFAEVTDFGQYPHPEVDMPLTPADVQLLLNTTLPSPFRKDAAGKPAQISVATYFEYMDKHFDDTVALINSVKAQNVQLASAVAALSAGLAKVAGGGVDPAVVAADVLKELGAALSAAVPPAKP